MRRAAIVLVILLTTLIPRAQSLPQDLVQTYVTVTDASNHYVVGLDQQNFELSEDKIVQKLETFSAEEVPLSAGIVLDVSDRMRQNLEVARNAAIAFFKSSAPESEYFLEEYADKSQVAVDFTTDVASLQNLRGFLPGTPEAAPSDALYQALDKMRSAKYSKKLLLVITNSFGANGHATYTQVRDLARSQSVQIYWMQIGNSKMQGWDTVRDIVELSGGSRFIVLTDKELVTASAAIGAEVRNQYMIGYRSSSGVADGRYRHISIKVNPPRGMPKLVVRAKEGYFASGYDGIGTKSDDINELMRRAAAYVASYDTRLTALTFTEDYDLKITRKSNPAAVASRPADRHIISDIVTVRDGPSSFPIRGVIRADGLPSSRSGSLDDLLALAPQAERPDINGLHDIFNLPTVPLSILGKKNFSRFAFHKTGQDTVEGKPVIKVGFEETSSESDRLSGTLWIDAGGQVWRTAVERNTYTNGTPAHFRSTVQYRADAELAALVPTSMQEHYEQLAFNIISDEQVTLDGNATYSSARSLEAAEKPFKAPSETVSSTFSSPVDPLYKIVVDVPLVTLDVTVSDERGPVTSLKATDFQVYENDRLQSLEHFTQASVPFNILLLFDWSGSTVQKRTFLEQAGAGLLEYLRSEDWIGIGRFASRLYMSGWSATRTAANARLAELGRPDPEIDHQRNNTYLYSSLQSTLTEELLPFSGRRRAMILLTDGQDSYHFHTFEASVTADDVQREKRQFAALLESVREARVPIFVIAVNTDLNREPLPPGVDDVKAFGLRSRAELNNYLRTVRQRLEQIAEVSGGKIQFPKTFEDIGPIYRAINQEIGTSFSLGYRSNVEDSGERRIVVKTKDSRLHVVQSRSVYRIP